MKNFLLKTCIFVLMLVMGASVTWANEYRIAFKTNTSDGSTAIASNTKVTTVINSGNEYVGGFTANCSKAYYNCKSGVKLGSSSAAGVLEFNIAEAYQSNVTSVIVKTVAYGSDQSSLTLEYNGGTKAGDNFTPGADYEYTFNKLTTLTSLKVTSTKRAYVSEVVITTSSDTPGGGTTPTTYSVNIADNIANGTVSASATTAAAGTTVTLTATPATGYEFGSWSVTNASTSAAISVTDNKFTMPAANVNVSATFNEEQAFDGTITTISAAADADIKFVTGSSSAANAFWANSTPLTANHITLSGSNGGSNSYSYYDGSVVRFYQNNTFTLTPSNGATIVKVEIVRQSTTGSNSGTINCSGLTAASGNTTTNTNVFTGTATSAVTFTAAAQARLTAIRVYSTGGTTPPAVDPQITNFIKTSTLNLEVGAGNYDVRECLNIPADYDQSAYAITTAIDGLTEKDGEFACVYPYLAFKKVGTYTVTVTAAAVPGKYAETKGTITVTVTGGTTPEPEPTVYESLAALVAAGTPTTDGRNVTVTLTDEVITGIYTTSAGHRNGIFLQVGEQEIEIYSKNVPETWEVGGTVSGTLYKCPWKLFNTTWELCPESWGLLTYTAPALQKLTITGEPKKEYYVGDSFSVAGLTVTANYANGTTLDVTEQIEWLCDPATFTEEGSAIEVYVIAGLGDKTAEQTYTVSVTMNPYVFIDGFRAIKGDIDKNVSYEAFKGDASTDPAVMGECIRLYQNGGYITIGGAKGVTISEVILTTSSTYDSTTIGTAIDDADAPTTGETVAKSSDYKVSGLNCNSISFYCLGTDKDHRLDIAAIKVKYTKVDINLASISVAGEGVGKEFLQNTRYSSEGITVTATYSDNSTADVTEKAVFSQPDMTTAGEKTIEVTYTEGGVTKTTSYTITVIAESIIAIKASDAPYAFVLGNEFNEGDLVVKAEYNSGNKDVVLGADLYRVVAPDMTTLGKKTVRVELTDNSEIYTEYAIYVLPTNTLFFESFDTNDGTGGNDGQWNGTIASNKIASDNTWGFTAAGGADQCAKFGTGNTAGSAVTRALEYEGSVTVSFKAAAWNGNSEAITIKVSIDGNDSSAQTIELTKGEWNDYSVTLDGLTAASKVKFAASQATSNRFFLDEVIITKAAEPAVGRVTNYIESLKKAEDGYTLDGLQKVVDDILQKSE